MQEELEWLKEQSMHMDPHEAKMMMDEMTTNYDERFDQWVEEYNYRFDPEAQRLNQESDARLIAQLEEAEIQRQQEMAQR